MKKRMQLWAKRAVLTLLCAMFLMPGVPVYATENAVPVEMPEESQVMVAETPPDGDSAPQPAPETPIAVAAELPLPNQPAEQSAELPVESSEEVPAVPPEIVIAQIQVGASGVAKDEYVAIYNNGDVATDITGWCLSNKSSVHFACFTAPGVQYLLGAKSYMAVSTAERVGSSAPTTLFVPASASSGSIVGSNDKVTLLNAAGEAMDVLGWVSQPSGNYGIERQWHETAPGKLQAGEAAWVWRQQLPVYGYIQELVECANGQLVASEDLCPPVDEPEEPTGPIVTCEGVVLSEIGANMAMQFIELHNPTDEIISLGGCKIKTNRSNATHELPTQELMPGGYHVVQIQGSGLTLTKTTTGTVYLLSPDGGTEYDTVEYSNLKQATSWSLVDGEWRQTYMPTPEGENLYMEFLPCGDGYFRNETTGKCNKEVGGMGAGLADCGEGRERNPETGRCRNIPVGSTFVPCPEGQERNAETNRCRSVLGSSSPLTPCREGQERNPLTNRCRNISAAIAELIPCNDGYERSPETNRCRKVRTDTPPPAGYAVEKVEQPAGQQAMTWLVIAGVGSLALAYAVWEWRREFAAGAAKIGGLFRRR